MDLMPGRTYKLSAEEMRKAGFEVPKNLEYCEITVGRIVNKKDQSVLDSLLYKHLIEKKWADDIAYDAAKEYASTGGPLESAVRALGEDGHLLELHSVIKEFKESMKQL